MQTSERLAARLYLLHDPYLLEQVVDLVQCNRRPEWTQCPGFFKHLKAKKKEDRQRSALFYFARSEGFLSS